MMDQAEKLREVIENLRLKNAVNRVIALPAPVKRTSRVITVTSGKGGVGKTNITINLAISLSEMGYRVIILDADFGLANIDVLFGIIPRFTLVDVINNKKNILEVLADGPKNIRFISGGSGVEELIKLDKNQISRFVENMSLLDKLADIIIIDTGAGLSENIMSFIMAADEVLLITTPEPTSITDAYALIKMVSNRDINKKIKMIVNKADSVAEANDVNNKLAMVADRFLGIKLEPMGYILNDDAVIKAVKQQQPFLLSFPKSTATKNIRQLSEALTQKGDDEAQQQYLGVKGFLNKLVSILKS
jgi:flagellar biosynthesis protein FlhG